MNKNNIDFAGSYVALGKCIGKTKYIVFGKEYTEKEVKSIFEKATSKKPTNIESHEEHDLLFVSGKCPVCRDWVNDSMSYCDSCGQALDWSGEDE